MIPNLLPWRIGIVVLPYWDFISSATQWLDSWLCRSKGKILKAGHFVGWGKPPEMSRKIFERDVMGCYSQMIHVWYIYLYIYHKNHLYVGKYTIDGSYGIWCEFAMKSEEVLFFCFGGRVASLETRCIACMRCWSRVERWCLVECVERLEVCTACLSRWQYPRLSSLR